MMPEFLNWAADTILAVTILTAIVLFIRKAVARRFGPHWAYALWAIPALRTVLPPLPALNSPQIEPAALSWQADVLPITLQTPLVESSPFFTQELLLSIGLMWLAGAIVFLLWNIGLYQQFITRLYQGRDLTVEKALIHLTNKAPIIVSNHVQGPLSFGLFKPMIALPIDFHQRYTTEEQELAIRHELAHIQNRDLWLNVLALLIRAIHWPNPLIHFAFKHFRSDQEMACDQRVLKTANNGERKVYGQALLKTMQPAQALAVCPLNTAQDIKERLTMLKPRWNKPGQSMIGALILAGISTTAVAATATYAEHQEVKIIKKKVKDIEVIEDGERKVVFLKKGSINSDEIKPGTIHIIRGDGGNIEFEAEAMSIKSGQSCEAGTLVIDEVMESKDGEENSHFIFCAKDGTEGEVDQAKALRTTIDRIKENAKEEEKRNKELIKRLEKRLKEVEKAKK